MDIVHRETPNQWAPETKHLRKERLSKVLIREVCGMWLKMESHCRFIVTVIRDFKIYAVVNENATKQCIWLLEEKNLAAI